MDKLNNGRILIAESRTVDRMREIYTEAKAYEDRAAATVFYVVTVETGTLYDDSLGSFSSCEYDTMEEALETMQHYSCAVSAISGAAEDLYDGKHE